MGIKGILAPLGLCLLSLFSGTYYSLRDMSVQFHPQFEVQEDWDFVSDHLPLGFAINSPDGQETFVKGVSWNVLNTQYIGWIYGKNGKPGDQGMSRSKITQLDKQSTTENNRLTLRDEEVIRIVKELTTTFDVIALQEVSSVLRRVVKDTLSTVGWKEVAAKVGEVATFYNENKLSCTDHITEPYPGERGTAKTVNVGSFLVKGSQSTVQVDIINTHVPFGKRGREALAYFCNNAREHNEKATENPRLMLVVGDMNVGSDRMNEALGQHWTHMESYLSHVSASNQPVDYDNAHWSFIPSASSPDQLPPQVSVVYPEQIPNLRQLIGLLTDWKEWKQKQNTYTPEEY